MGGFPLCRVIAAASETEESPFGVMTHLAHACPRSIMPLTVKAGIKYIRYEIFGSSVEQQKGQFHIEEKFRRHVPEAQQLGREPLIRLAYANQYYDEGDFPTSRARWLALGVMPPQLPGNFPRFDISNFGMNGQSA